MGVIFLPFSPLGAVGLASHSNLIRVEFRVLATWVGDWTSPPRPHLNSTLSPSRIQIWLGLGTIHCASCLFAHMHQCTLQVVDGL